VIRKIKIKNDEKLCIDGGREKKDHQKNLVKKETRAQKIQNLKAIFTKSSQMKA
jgi:hypothetical protein